MLRCMDFERENRHCLAVSISRIDRRSKRRNAQLDRLIGLYLGPFGCDFEQNISVGDTSSTGGGAGADSF